MIKAHPICKHIAKAIQLSWRGHAVRAPLAQPSSSVLTYLGNTQEPSNMSLHTT